ncbi:MAG TPA: ArsR family transcriptional regulator [Gemmatimonadaceae bacterium]
MSAVALNKRFLETTRGQILTLIRRGRQTVEELAEALELTDNAVRNHLSTLERDSLIQQSGVRRTSGAGKPALLYELHPDAEILFSRAYPSVLTTVVESVIQACPPDQTDELLRDTGRRLAWQVGGRATGSLENRVRAAAAVLTALGGEVEVTREDGALRIRGSGCPLSATVSKQPKLCRAVETLVAEVTGAHTRSCCEHGERPRCCFAIDDD